ncbi:MAG: GNA1162 family protein [Nitrospinota bacterium]
MKKHRFEKRVNRRKGGLFKGAALFVFLVILVGAGCTSPRTKLYIRESANFQYINNVAVLPFNNMSEDKYAGEKVRSVVIMELLNSGAFEVSEEGEVNKVTWEVFREMGFREGDIVSLDIETMRRIAERLGVQALLVGTVEQYGQARIVDTPSSMVSLSLRLVEANSGVTLWRGVSSIKGYAVWRTILGLAQEDEIDLSDGIVSNLVSTLMNQ